jgi:ribonuclease HI
MSKLIIHTDGSCYHIDGRMGLGIAFFEDDDPVPIFTMGINKHERLGTNNEAEYLAVINALHELCRPTIGSWDEITIYSDSQIVINQIKGTWTVRGENLIPLNNNVYSLLSKLPPIKFEWCPRTHPRQKLVDKLSKKSNPYFINKKK